MFDRFTERARGVVVLAQEEARTLKHDYIGTEHILLGLLREEEGLAARALHVFDITFERVRERVVQEVAPGEGTDGPMPFTPRAKKVLELALRESMALGDDLVGTEHILLGLVRENEGLAARILLAFDADSAKIRNEVILMLSGRGSRQRRLRGRRRCAEPVVPERRPGLDPAWLEGLDAVLERLVSEIRLVLAREPDSGDLLLALASAPDATAADALRELGIDLDTLCGTIERVREHSLGHRMRIQQRIEDTRGAKREAIEAKDFERAARLRDQERELTRQLRATHFAEAELLDAIRQRLGIPGSPGS